MAKTETQFGTFEELMETVAAPLEPIARRLRVLIHEIDPDTTEVVRLGDRAATYGVGPRKIKEGYCYILPHKKWINLGFFQAHVLDDQDGLLEGTGKKMRHVKVRNIEMVDTPAIRILIEGALAERRAATA